MRQHRDRLHGAHPYWPEPVRKQRQTEEAGEDGKVDEEHADLDRMEMGACWGLHGGAEHGRSEQDGRPDPLGRPAADERIAATAQPYDQKQDQPAHRR